MAFINLHAVLGSIPYLCEMDERAAELIKGKKASIGFFVKGGPEGRLVFEGGKCSFFEGASPADIRLSFSSPEKFNKMIDGTYTPVPTKGLHKVGFLLKCFMPLTDILSSYLRASEEALFDKTFFKNSTELMFHVILSVIAQIGNEDKVGRASASYITNGCIRLSAGEEIVLGVEAREHRLTALHASPESYTSYMAFESIETARALFAL